MKLALVFLACCIGASWQQNVEWDAAMKRNAVPFMVVMDDPSANGNPFSGGSYKRGGGRGSVDRQRDSAEVSGRQPYNHNENINNYYHYSILPSSPSSDFEQFDNFGMDQFDQIDSRHANRQNAYQQLSPRLFNPLNLFFPQFFYSLLSSISSSAFSTVTSYLILNSTLTTSLITPCIPISEFATGVDVKTPMTQLCRRRRNAIMYGEIADSNDYDHESYENQQLTSEVMSPDVLRQRRLAMEQPEIVSSKDAVISMNDVHLANSLVRKGRNSHHTVTSTFTSYSFIYVNTTRPIAIASTSVLCLPSGFAVCT